MVAYGLTNSNNSTDTTTAPCKDGEKDFFWLNTSEYHHNFDQWNNRSIKAEGCCELLQRLYDPIRIEGIMRLMKFSIGLPLPLKANDKTEAIPSIKENKN